MLGLAAVAIGLLVVASMTVGVRLVVRHRRTGGVPELLLGGMLLLSVGVGYPLMIVAPQLGDPWAGRLQILSLLAVASGYSLLYGFTWLVFRREARWARALTAAGALVLVGEAAHQGLDVLRNGPYAILEAPLRNVVLQAGGVLAAYLWTAWESFRYHRMMRRRVRIGLADAVVCNRFLLWGLMALAVSFGVVVNVTALATHTNAFESPWILLLSSTTGCTQAVLLMLTFLPPDAYAGWVRSRAAAESL